MATSAVLPATTTAVKSAVTRLLHIAASLPDSPFHGIKPENLAISNGRVMQKNDQLPKVVGVSMRSGGQVTASGVPFEEVLKMANLSGITATGKTAPSFEDPKAKQYSLHSYGCHFAEVEWEPELARLRVSRIASVFDCGRIINPLAGRNQIEGAVVMGIGMALFEHTSYDPRNGQPINIQWEVRNTGQGLRITDVKIEGVSMVMTHRSDFNSYISSHGGKVEPLIDELEAKSNR